MLLLNVRQLDAVRIFLWSIPQIQMRTVSRCISSTPCRCGSLESCSRWSMLVGCSLSGQQFQKNNPKTIHIADGLHKNKSESLALSTYHFVNKKILQAAFRHRHRNLVGT